MTPTNVERTQPNVNQLSDGSDSIETVTIQAFSSQNVEGATMGSSALPSMSSVISSIRGLPASAIVPVCRGSAPVLHDQSSGQWELNASPGENDGWFVGVSVTKGGVSRLLLNVRIDGGVEEANLAMDLIRKRLSSITPDHVTYG